MFTLASLSKFSYRKDWFCGRAFGFDGPINIQSDGGVEFAHFLRIIERDLKDIFEPLGVS